MPPTLLFAPDEVEGLLPTLEKPAVPVAENAGPPTTKPPGQSTLTQIFKLSPTSSPARARRHTDLLWQDNELEIRARDEDPGFLIELPVPLDNRLVLRLTLRTERAVALQIFSQTIAEPAITRDSQLSYPLDVGLNQVTAEIVRDAPIRFLRIDPANAPGVYHLCSLTVLGTPRPRPAQQDIGHNAALSEAALELCPAS